MWQAQKTEKHQELPLPLPGLQLNPPPPQQQAESVTPMAIRSGKYLLSPALGIVWVEWEHSSELLR